MVHHLLGIQALPSGVAWQQELKVEGGLVVKVAPNEMS